MQSSDAFLSIRIATTTKMIRQGIEITLYI